MSGNRAMQELLEKHLMLFAPETYLPRYIRTARDIYQNRTLLRQLPSNQHTLNYLLDIIIKTVQEGIRFRTLDCLKVVKELVKGRPPELVLPSDTVDKLFSLYQEFVFHRNEEVQWCVSWFIKSVVLSDDSVEWLISNYRRSEHLVNRLLDYPTRHPRIVEWAEDIWRSGELRNRKSQVIGLLISDEIPAYVNERDNTSLIWAIYYARVPAETKQKLLTEHYSPESIDAFLEVCRRLEYPSVIKSALDRLKQR